MPTSGKRRWSERQGYINTGQLYGNHMVGIGALFTEKRAHCLRRNEGS
jgi:hypothetical protein